MVTLDEVLNFRDAPGGERIMELPRLVTLTVLDWQSGWVKVDWYGAAGWVSDNYVTARGDCG